MAVVRHASWHGATYSWDVVTSRAKEFHPAFEEYCEAIWELREDDIDVIQARIAERLEVSRPAVSEMIRRMEHESLINLGSTITLTPTGVVPATATAQGALTPADLAATGTGMTALVSCWD